MKAKIVRTSGYVVTVWVVLADSTVFNCVDLPSPRQRKIRSVVLQCLARSPYLVETLGVCQYEGVPYCVVMNHEGTRASAYVEDVDDASTMVSIVSNMPRSPDMWALTVSNLFRMAASWCHRRNSMLAPSGNSSRGYSHGRLVLIQAIWICFTIVN
jgi:hypothetical protein